MKQMNENSQGTQEFWDGFYQERDPHQVWSGRANPLLVREAGALQPGRALELGCGEGADAIWLAGRGWQVTATDVSDTALERSRDHAREAGVTNPIDWQRHDLAASFPDGDFDLVSVQFLHSPVARPGERAAILRRAATAVAPGGALLVVGHGGWPSWVTPEEDYHFDTNAEVLEQLNLEQGRWTVITDETVVRDLTGPEGQEGRRDDHVLQVQRLT